VKIYWRKIIIIGDYFKSVDNTVFLLTGKTYSRAAQKTVHFSAVLELYGNYISENYSEQKCRPSKRLLPRKKIILEIKQWTNGGFHTTSIVYRRKFTCRKNSANAIVCGTSSTSASCNSKKV
jgi:hypothetical protein